MIDDNCVVSYVLGDLSADRARELERQAASDADLAAEIALIRAYCADGSEPMAIHRAPRRALIKQALAVAASTAAVTLTGGVLTGSSFGATKRKQLEDKLGTAQREREQAEAALRLLAAEGYLTPARFTDAAGSGGIVIQGNNILLCSGIVARKRVARLIVHLSNSALPIEITPAEMKPLPAAGDWVTFAKSLTCELNGEELDVKLVAELTDETRRLREDAGLDQPGTLTISRSFIATPLGLVVHPGTRLPVLGIRANQEIIDLAPSFDVTPIRSGHLAAFLLASAGEHYMVAVPRPIATGTPTILSLRLPFRLSEGTHQLVLGLAPSSTAWPSESYGAETPMRVDRLPDSDGAIAYSAVPLAAIDPERRLAQWVLRQGGKVKLHSPDGQRLMEEFSDAKQLPVEKFHVQSIDLTNCPLPASALQANLVGAGSLQGIFLSSTATDDATLGVIVRNHRGIVWLSLGSTKITDDGINGLADLQSLALLTLNDTRVTDRSVQALAGLRNLVELHLHDTAVSDESVRALEQGFPKLNTVRLDRTMVTSTGVEKLRTARPGLSVSY
ncbi:MAG: hypothetical protein HY000_39925 [Planctomycetes bacterium]|nr:hypothetical protein [Planctomycetota bacterium]